MNPALWGNGSWFLIFICIFKYQNNLESLKRLLYLICNSLPCNSCKLHALTNIEQNNIISSNSLLEILLFFVKLRNKFQEEKKNYNMIIPIDKIKLENNKITLKTKAEILSRFCFEFEEISEIEYKRNINLLHNRFKELLK